MTSIGMAKWSALALLMLGSCSCAHVQGVTSASSQKAPNTDAILRLIGRFSACHACPVSEHLALTSAHCTDLRPFDSSVPLYPLQWGDGALGEGILTPVYAYPYRDLAVMRSEVPFTRWYPIATERPKPGDRVTLLEYDWRDAERAYADKRLDAKVVVIQARTVTFVPGGQRGSSGSCLLNAASEVVGINSWRWEPDDGGQAAGLAFGVWGEPVPSMAPEARE